MSILAPSLPAVDARTFVRRPCPALLPLAIVLALASTPLWAQADEDAERRDPVYLSPLVSDADEVDPYTEPAASSSISQDQIAVFGDQNLDDALRATPGMFTRDSPQNPGIAVNIRGVEGSGRVNMRIDGIRQNFRFVGHEAQGLVYVDPALLAGIDIQRGAVSGVGGAGALTGSANFRTLGVDDVVAGDGTQGVRLGSSWTSNGGGFGANGAAALRTDAWGLLAAYSTRSPDDYRNGEGETVVGTRQDVDSALLKLEYRPAPDHLLNVGGVFYENEFLANSYDQTMRSRQYSARYAFTPADGRLDLRANLYRSEVRMRYDASPFVPGGGGSAGRVIDDTGNGFDLYNTSHFSDWISSTYGVEYFKSDIDVINSAAVPDRGVNPSGEQSIGGVFSDTRFRLGMVDLIAGLRYDRFGVEGSGSVTAANPVGLPPGPYTVDRSEGRFSPKLTLALNPNEWFQPYLTWSKSFRPPTVSETLTGGDHPAQDGPPMSFFPNPDLKPEIVDTWELGTNIRADGWLTADDQLRLKLNYYRNSVENYVTAMFGPGVYFGNHPGESRVRGYEIEGGYDAGFVFAALSFNDTDSSLPSQINGFGAQSYIPDQVLSATLGGRVLRETLTFGVRYLEISESFIGEENAYGGAPSWEPGYSLVDLFSNWQLGRHTQLRLNVSNVLDKPYTPALSTPAGGTSVDTGRGRAYAASVRVQF